MNNYYSDTSVSGNFCVVEFVTNINCHAFLPIFTSMFLRAVNAFFHLIFSPELSLFHGSFAQQVLKQVLENIQNMWLYTNWRQAYKKQIN